MPDTKPTLLIVDDEATIRSTLSQIFSEFGHGVRVAADGLSALSEMGRGVPDILLSDLNMPGMSGFELLTVVRRHFPTIRVIAMSGAFCGDEVPSGLAADAFYQKGSSVAALLRIIDTLPWPERKIEGPSKMQTSLETEMSGYNGSPEASVMTACPECKKGFAYSLAGASSTRDEIGCISCGNLIRCVVARRSEKEVPRTFQRVSA